MTFVYGTPVLACQTALSPEIAYTARAALGDLGLDSGADIRYLTARSGAESHPGQSVGV